MAGLQVTGASTNIATIGFAADVGAGYDVAKGSQQLRLTMPGLGGQGTKQTAVDGSISTDNWSWKLVPELVMGTKGENAGKVGVGYDASKMLRVIGSFAMGGEHRLDVVFGDKKSVDLKVALKAQVKLPIKAVDLTLSGSAGYQLSQGHPFAETSTWNGAWYTGAALTWTVAK